MKTLQTMKYSLPFQTALMGVFFVLTFLFSGAQAQAASVTWYVNPIVSTCYSVADANVDPTLSPGGPGWTIVESVTYQSDNEVFSYSTCSPFNGNDTFSATGSVAGFKADMDKTTFAPGEYGRVAMIGMLEPYGGSDFANALLFFSLGNPVLDRITCWILRCPVTRSVAVGATVPHQQIGYDRVDHVINDPTEGFGFQGIFRWCPQDIVGCWDVLQYHSYDSRDQRGAVVLDTSFKAPLTPGNYSVDLVGCHEKFYCVSVPISFNVAGPPPSPPTINVRF